MMVKRKEKVEVEPMVAAGVVVEAEPVVEAEVVVEERKGKRGYAQHDLVRVRVLAEMGILAGKAVWKGELHRVRYWQYLEARKTGGEGYLLVG